MIRSGFSSPKDDGSSSAVAWMTRVAVPPRSSSKSFSQPAYQPSATPEPEDRVVGFSARQQSGAAGTTRLEVRRRIRAVSRTAGYLRGEGLRGPTRPEIIRSQGEGPAKCVVPTPRPSRAPSAFHRRPEFGGDRPSGDDRLLNRADDRVENLAVDELEQRPGCPRCVDIRGHIAGTDAEGGDRPSGPRGTIGVCPWRGMTDVAWCRMRSPGCLQAGPR